MHLTLQSHVMQSGDWLSHTHITLLQEVKTLNQSEINYVLQIIPEDSGDTEPNSTLISEGLIGIHTFTKEHQKAKVMRQLERK